MKTLTIISTLALAALLSLPRAEARQFYTLGVKAKLVYTNIDGSHKKMGTLKGELRTGDDGQFAELKLGDHSYAITFDHLELGAHRRPAMTVVLGRDSIADILHRANHSWLRSSSLRQKVNDLIDRYMAPVAANAQYRASASYSDGYYSDDDYTKTTYQFHDDQSPESLHLTIDFDNRADVN